MLLCNLELLNRESRPIKRIANSKIFRSIPDEWLTTFSINCNCNSRRITTISLNSFFGSGNLAVPLFIVIYQYLRKFFDVFACEYVRAELLGSVRGAKGAEEIRNSSSLRWVSGNSANSRDQNSLSSSRQYRRNDYDRACVYCTCLRLCAHFLHTIVRLRAAVGDNCKVDRRALPLPVGRRLCETAGVHNATSESSKRNCPAR